MKVEEPGTPTRELSGGAGHHLGEGDLSANATGGQGLVGCICTRLATRSKKGKTLSARRLETT